MEREIFRPRWTQRGIRGNRMSYRDVPIYGADTETINGRPYTFQLWGDNYKGVVFVTGANITERFLETLWDHVPTDARVFLHNLEFDLPVLFFPFLDQFAKSNAFTMKAPGFECRVFFSKVNFAEVKLKGRTWFLVDTFAFFKASLDSLARTFKLPEKMAHPKKLGQVRYRGAALEYFKRYALRDAQTAAALGREIMGFHKLYDVRPCISAPQLSAQIFRHRFIPEGGVIPSNPVDVDQAAVLSYHGGKNGLYVPPGIYRGVRVYDISSAYPYAMTQVPNFLGCLYGWVSSRAELKKRVPGVYCISGESLGRTYNPLRDHSFRPVVGRFEKIWVTSYELETLERHHFLADLTVHEAFVVRATRRRPNPLIDFATHFYDLKQKEKGPLREFFKIMLNSLYGKFIQNVVGDTAQDLTLRGSTLEDPTTYYQAGGLWNPLLATLITGWVRAHLTELEIKYRSLHSSTDSIVIQGTAPTSERMGDLTLKTQGTAVLLRPKLYLVWDRKRNVTAYALHGYHGYLGQFVSLLRSGKRRYAHQRMRKVKEAARQGLRPLTMETFFKTINLELTNPLPIPRLTYGGRKI
jgi:hypothetical protein